MDAAWSNFLFQNTPTQNQAEGSLQSELMSVHTSSPQTPPTEHIDQPPSTVDTTALSEEPLPSEARGSDAHPAATSLVKPVSRPGRVPHVCPICNKQFKNNYNLRRHQSVHTGRPANQNPTPVRKNHACETCGKAFRDVYHLNRHRLSHSDEKPFSCPICQQRFKRKDRMSHHVRSHQGGVEKPYICPHCSKAFSRPDHLNSHVRQVHSSERPFKCPTCESSFATKDRLRAHMIRHEEKVPCHICGKLLSAAYITDHMRVHNQSQHHVCHLCNRSFTTLTYLRVHAQKHHGQEWKDSPGGFGGTTAGGVLVCHLCGIHCKTPTQLQGHMGTHNASQEAQSPATSNVTASSSVSLNMVAAPTVYVTGGTVVDLLVTDCSSIAAPQSQS
ncbi:myc-associated zinc finger protein-like isoform X2 [Nerophis ophidion]|uniref:myc-associated zinc finger protein isoform X2 n=1 Tax=Nerophis ophidion TaxID=159077 RepID=UPI002AE00997|nr:myc-associated zinc finger protein isoform X2 [Nerophis ophidion]XP_061765428.1 myc-associated zinc finger protein isoform X2 [Nerophis ophidion]XP_061765517.1 myc-associated zinc finger protein-like isoform X2 [Nerophis ophidion]XP_061765518.1 myc-associated zinc finger protein-like isoform X2 [Nerophis ophidion]